VLMFCAIVRWLVRFDLIGVVVSFAHVQLVAFGSVVADVGLVALCSVPHHVMVGTGSGLYVQSVVPRGVADSVVVFVAMSWFLGERVFGLHFSDLMMIGSKRGSMLSDLPSQ